MTPENLHPECALPSPEIVQFTLDRLDFWSSDEIAPLVQECEVAPRYRTCESEEEAELQLQTDSLHVPMTSFLNCLRKFTNLKKFSAELANFTQAGLCNLCQIPLLREVIIQGCDIVPGETIDTASLELRTVKLVYRVGGAVSRGPKNLWLAIVHREHLRGLEWTGTVSVAGDAISQGPPFPNVHTLGFTANLSTMNHNLTTLSKFPAVRTLRGNGWGGFKYESTNVPSLRASDVLPLLQEYRGTYSFLETFLPKPTLTRLVLDLTFPGLLLSQLHGQYSHITSLYVNLTNLDHHALSTICISLPGLIDLCARIEYIENDEEDEYEDGVNTRATDFFSTLKNTQGLPSTLQRLALAWEFVSEHLEDGEQNLPVALPENIPDFLEIREKLRERCPALRTLWLDGQDFVFKWRQLLDREEMEQDNKIEASEILCLREKFQDFWKGR